MISWVLGSTGCDKFFAELEMVLNSLAPMFVEWPPCEITGLIELPVTVGCSFRLLGDNGDVISPEVREGIPEVWIGGSEAFGFSGGGLSSVNFFFEDFNRRGWVGVMFEYRSWRGEGCDFGSGEICEAIDGAEPRLGWGGREGRLPRFVNKEVTGEFSAEWKWRVFESKDSREYPMG